MKSAFRLGALLLPALAFAQGGPPPPAVRIAEVRLASLAPTIQLPGTVISRNDARISAEVAGRLTWVAEVGTAVAGGEPVARVDDTELALQLEEYRGLVAREESRRGFLAREVERLRQLVAQNIGAKNQLDQMESDLQVSTSDIAVARARLGQIQMQLERTRLRAPFDGVVTERLRSPGERTEVGDEIVRLVDPGNLEVVARAPLSSVTFIEQGDELSVTSQDKAGAGTVRTLVPFGDAGSHMFELRVVVLGGEWRVGENVRLAVPTAKASQVLAVPRDALVLRREGTSVFRVGDGDVVEQIDVEAGVGAGELIAVQGPLAPGDRVVVRGAERLRSGQPVRILDEAPGEQGAARATPASR